MTPDQIRKWRPTRFEHFIGERNRPVIRRLQRAVLRDRIPSPMLLIAPFGYGKTSLVRLVMRAINCRGKDPRTGDPCGDCPQCRCSGIIYNGQGSPFMRLELDCTQLGRGDVVGITADYFFRRDVALFFDEFHHLHEKNSQEALLKFFEDYRGLAFAAVMADRFEELAPPLRERFVQIWLSPPTEDELTTFFVRQCEGEWGIEAAEWLIRLMIRGSGLSFRICLKILAAAAEEDSRRLTLELIGEFLAVDHASPAADEPGVRTILPDGQYQVGRELEGPFVI